MQPHSTTYQPETPGKQPVTLPWRKILKITALVTGGALLLLFFSVFSLRWVNPPFTSFTLQEDWEGMGMERYNLREWWVPEAELPNSLKWAVVASEDQRFWDHWGLDIESIRDAMEEQREGERVRGASTISQQVAKNLYLWPAQSYIRKGIEAGITVMIELIWPKERILEMYLNIAQFGPGIYGAGKASDEFFGRTPSGLEPDMSARLAAVLPSPNRMRVEPPSPFAQERSQWILRQMTQLTGISYQPADTVLPEEDPDPLPWDFEIDMDADTVRSEFPAGQDTLMPEELPDSLLRMARPDSTYPLDENDTADTDTLREQQ